MYYRYMNAHHPTRTWEVTAVEHRSIVSACVDRHDDVAAQRLAFHYARTALTVLGQVALEFDPVAVRMALHITGANTPLAEPMESRRQARNGNEARANARGNQRM